MRGMTGKTPKTRQWPHWVALAWLVAQGAGAQTPAQLRCEVTYAGAVHWVVAEPVQDPYSVPAVDIGGRFRIKPVLLGTSEKIDLALVYVYVMDGEQAVLIQQAKYKPPFPPLGSLTGQQYLYAGPLERELRYDCFLIERTR